MTKSNTIKIVAALVVLAGVLGVLFLGPLLQDPPDPGPEVNVPSMENIPPSGTHLSIEVQPEEEHTE
jgi:hypothetical protein